MDDTIQLTLDLPPDVLEAIAESGPAGVDLHEAALNGIRMSLGLPAVSGMVTCDYVSDNPTVSSLAELELADGTRPFAWTEERLAELMDRAGIPRCDEGE